MKEFGEEYSEPEEMDEAAERPEPGVGIQHNITLPLSIANY